MKGILLLLACVAAVAVICFIGYRAFGGQSAGSTGDDTRAFVQVDMQLAQIQDRLDQLEEENHRLEAAQALANSKKLNRCRIIQLQLRPPGPFTG